MPLDHVALTVADRERSAAFYGEHFGLTERVHDDEHLLILGDAEGRPARALRRVSRAAAHLPRTNHFGFQLASRATTSSRARERFRAAGVDRDRSSRTYGPTRVQVADPDGYRVEVYASARAPTSLEGTCSLRPRRRPAAPSGAA